MMTRILVLGCYFLAVIALGFLAKSRLSESPSRFFLAGRGLGSLVLLGTLAATNFSAFTVFGASGAGYRDGLSFFPIMGFGTGFMAITFWLVGRKVWRLGKEYGLITPSELISTIYGDKWLAAVFAVVMVFFTVPYLALQPLAGGKVLAQLYGLPQWAGASLVTAIILLYTLRGGLKAVAWTDVLQGLLMFVLMAVALAMITSHHGGWNAAFAKVHALKPSLFSRPGPNGTYSPAIWFSFIFLWFFCDPMFPQLFQRFYAAKSEKGLARSMLFYPLVCTLVFALPVAIGVLGWLDFPDLAGRQSDNIIPMLMTRVAGDFMGTLVLAAGLAALMSTMDSQLLTLGSIFSRDLFPLVSRKKAEKALVGRVFVIFLAVAGLLVALLSDATMLNLGLTAFTGLAVLFPSVFFGLYLNKPRAASAWVSLICGEGAIVLNSMGLMPKTGFLLAVPVIVISLVSYLLVHFLTGPAGLPRLGRKQCLVAAGFLAMSFLAHDLWSWGRIKDIYLGWPLWAWYFAGLSGLQMLLGVWWVKGDADA